MTTFGEFKVLASVDAGVASPKEDAEVTCRWNPLANILALSPWFLLLGAMVGIRENRNWRSLLVVVPIGVLYAGWYVFKTLGVVDTDHFIAYDHFLNYDLLFEAIIIGIGLLMLVAVKLRDCSTFERVIWSGLVLASLWCIAAWSYGLKPLNGFYSFLYDVHLQHQFMIAMVVMFLALLGVRVVCRGRYSAMRLMLSLPLCTFVAGAAVMITYGLCVFVVKVVFMGDMSYGYRIFLYEVDNYFLGRFLNETFISCVVVSAAMYLVMLPYAILVMSSSYYRERFLRGVNGDNG